MVQQMKQLEDNSKESLSKMERIRRPEDVGFYEGETVTVVCFGRETNATGSR